MEFSVSTKAPESCPCDALAVGIFKGAVRLEGTAAKLDAALGGALSTILTEERFDAQPNHALVVHTHGKLPAKRIIMVGLGPKPTFTLDRLRQAAATVVRRAEEVRAKHLALPPLTVRPHSLEALTQARVEGAILGAYRFARYKANESPPVEHVELLATDPAQHRSLGEGIRRGQVFANATVFARDLVNEPPNVLPPGRLAEIVAHSARANGLRCSILDVDAMQRLGMGAILAIGAGSAEPPCLIVLEYAPPKPKKTVAIVGKGVTFDSGGLNLKSSDGMVGMKADMAGGAVVIATLNALPELHPQVRVFGVIAAVENLPSGRATRPGDIVRALNGKTIEITNTDAEGRVLLADALAYAARQKPDEIIDIATLTGSAMVALGSYAAAVMGNRPALVRKLVTAAERAGERVWQLPLYEEFLEEMRSPIADLRNSAGRYGGAEKAAIFLREFVDGRPWVHVDIAPTAFLDHEEGTGPYTPKGATGYGVRTLLTYLLGVT